MLADGTAYRSSNRFRWVFCQLEVLRHCLPASIRQTLNQLPETLDETYARVLRQIPRANQAHVHRMLQCLTVAVHPLRVEELAEVLAFEFDTSQGAIPRYRADWRPRDQVHAVLSTCSSLVTIVDDYDSHLVQFSHFSVKEFLVSDRLTSNLSLYQIFPGPAHTTFAQACLGFLLHIDDHTDQETIDDFPLAKYAAFHWFTHAQFEDVASYVKDGMESLFDCDKPHFAAWVRIFNIDEPYQAYLDLPSKIPSPLYYTALFGFHDLVENLSIKHPQNINAVGGQHDFPLLAALSGKHARAAEILIKHGANVDIKGKGKQTPLHEAITDVAMVRLQLNRGADVNSQRDDLSTPLHLAARCGELAVVQVLLEHKPDVNSRDACGETPLHIASWGDYLSREHCIGIVQPLLDRGADVNSLDLDCRTPFHSASLLWRVEIVRMLLDHNANVKVKSEQGETPLHLVSRGHYDSHEHGIGVARILLERGVDVNALDKSHRTALHPASFGKLEIARLLLDHGANANVENARGETPLHLVSRGRYDSDEHGVGIAQLLLERGVDHVDAQAKNKWTPLHLAAFNGRLELTRVLLDHGADMNAKNFQDETPLHLMLRGKYRSREPGAGIALLLLERGMNANARAKNNWTPFHLAALRGGPRSQGCF